MLLLAPPGEQVVQHVQIASDVVDPVQVGHDDELPSEEPPPS